MMALFEQQGGTYQKKGDYFIPCVVTKKRRKCISGYGQTVIDSILNNFIEYDITIF